MTEQILKMPNLDETSFLMQFCTTEMSKICSQTLLHGSADSQSPAEGPDSKEAG